MAKEKKGVFRRLMTLLLIVAVAGGVYYFYTNKKSGKSAIADDTVVATIDGDKVYLSDVKEAAASVPQLAELPFDMIYPQLLENYLNARAVLKSAKASDVGSDERVQKAIENATEQILSQAYLTKKLEKMATDDKLKELYDKDIVEYKPQPEVHARHILVKTKKEAADILIQLKAGAKFEDLANKKSLDTGANGGDLGYFAQNMMIPDFATPVFKMKKGQLSQPIQTPFGWHVVEVLDRRMGTPPSFEDVKPQLRQQFMEQNAAELLAQERKDHEVQVKVPTLTKKPVEVPEEMDEAVSEEEK